MITIDKICFTYYYASKARAQSLVNLFNRNEEMGWRYELGESPRGYYIRIIDENGNVLGDL